MEPEPEIVVGALAVATIAAAFLLGYLSERSLSGAGLLGIASAIASGLCVAGLLLWDRLGLLAAVLLVTYLASRVGKSFGGERGSKAVPALWLAYCASCGIGYWAGGVLGLVTITLPSLLIFWGGLFGVSRHLLPLSDTGQRTRAFRALCTYTFGTNYPYHVLEDRALKERVAGSPFGQLFAGPGIILTDPAHAPIMWDGLRFTRVGEPGLTFTERMEAIYQTVDLRPQLRSFSVEAITKDGIRCCVPTFIPFQLDARGQQPKLGTAYPLAPDSVCKAVWQEPVEQGERHSWDQAVEIAATRLIRKIISAYECDELCPQHTPRRDPRSEITTDLVKQLRHELQPSGIDVIGGGIGNLEPADPSIIENRIGTWREKWEHKITAVLGKGKALALEEVERAYIETQTELIDSIQNVVQSNPQIDTRMLTQLAALRFLEAMEEMACAPAIQAAAPSETGETVEYLRRALSLD